MPDPHRVDQLVAPALSVVVDLDRKVAPLDTAGYRSALVLLRNGGRPVGEVVLRLSCSRLTGPELRQRALDAWDGEVEPVGAAGPRATPTTLPRVGVVVTTCGNPVELVRCVDSVLASCDVEVEVVVVDNRPDDPSTASAVASSYGDRDDVRLVAEPRRGLSWARNAGIAALTTPVVAWTDDDVVVDPRWAAWLAGALAVDGAELACGLVRPFELVTPAQIWRERERGYAGGFERREHRLSAPPPDQPLFPYTTGRIGTGANMAARREVLVDLGGFDVALGAGTRAAGGEDLDLILRFLRRGSTVVYEPAAIVSHRHHPDAAALAAQARSYGTGLASYLAKIAFTDARGAALAARKAVPALAHLRSLRADTGAAPGVDEATVRRIRRAELVGLVVGAWRGLVDQPQRRRSAG